MGHHKIKILTLPFAFFIYFISTNQLLNNEDLYRNEFVCHVANLIALSFILVSYFWLKEKRTFLILTAAMAITALASSVIAYAQILMGNMQGTKNIYILFMLPFGLFLIYFYYELYD